MNNTSVRYAFPITVSGPAVPSCEMGVMRLGTSNGIKIVAGEAVTGGY